MLDVPQPPSLHQLIDDGLDLIGIPAALPSLSVLQPLAQRIAAHVLAGHNIPAPSPDPAQNPASVGVMIGQPDLADGSAGVRPEVISPQPHGGFDEPRLDGLWFGTAVHGPVDIAERASQTQNL